MSFLYIWEQSGISPTGGILGFARNYEFSSLEDNGALLYYKLFDQNKISSKLFASYIADDPTTSFIQLGTYDQVGDYYTGAITWIPVMENFFWMATSSKIMVRSKVHKLIQKPIEMILDTGTTYMYFDKWNGAKLIKKILRGGKWFKMGGTYWTDCTLSRYESIFLDIGGQFVEVPPSAYIRDVGGSRCTLAIGTFSFENTWLIGDVLFRNYYNVWDEDNGRIGFALRTGADATVAPFSSTS